MEYKQYSKRKLAYRDFRTRKVDETEIPRLKWMFIRFIQLNMPDGHAKRFEVTPDVQPILSTVFNWIIGDVTAKDYYRGILLTGEIGLAKTSIMKAAIDLITNLYEDTACEYITAFGITRLHRQKDNESAYKLNRLYTCRMLFIDDLGMEDQKVYDIKPLIELIHHRYDSRRITSYTTNSDSAELAERYSPTIEDKINHTTIRLEFEGASKRD